MTSVQGLTEAERRTLSQFKMKIADVMKPSHDDYYLVKWLKARSFSLPDAEKMFRESMAYRKKMQVDSLVENYTPPKVLQEYFPGGTFGHDKDGSPIWMELPGKYDFRGLMMSARKSDFEKLKLYQCEMAIKDCEKQSLKLGRRVDGMIIIFDGGDVGVKMLWKPGLDMFVHLLQILEDNYPEMAKRLILVNAPSIFPILYRICRPMVSDDMMKKVLILGSNYKTELLKLVDADQLPAYLGGTMTDPDGNPQCITKICQGGTVPKSYYLSEPSNTDHMEITVVQNGDSLKLDFQATRPDSVLRWEFRTEENDIGFGVHFMCENGDRKQIIPVKRVSCNLVTEDGSIHCDYLGTYTVVFDNTYSWTKVKKLFHRVELIDFDETVEKEIEALFEITHL